MKYEKITEQIIGCAYKVYNTMGFGYLESVYAKCMAIELGKDKINVNAIGAGVIYTDINREFLSDPKVEEYWCDRLPWGRVGQPEDLIGISIFLATDEADYITGTTVFVDGGYTIE